MQLLIHLRHKWFLKSKLSAVQTAAVFCVPILLLANDQSLQASDHFIRFKTNIRDSIDAIIEFENLVSR